MQRETDKKACVRIRNPQKTRTLLIDAAFYEIYQNGYQAADLASILARSGLTKGALYHHFASKELLGFAVIDDVLAAHLCETWLIPLSSEQNPIECLITILNNPSRLISEVRLGCPINNLSQEMSPLDEGFRLRLATLFKKWILGLGEALRRGQAKGLVKADIQPFEVAANFVATYEGYVSLAKTAQDDDVFALGLRQLCLLAKGFRP